MKERALLAVVVAMAVATYAAPMRPCAIVYGDVRDAYGIRLSEGAQVSVFLETNEVVRTAVGVYPRGLNYRVTLDVYDPLGAEPDQVVPGAEADVRIKIGVTFQPTIGDTTFTVPGNGAAVPVHLTIGTDSDGDGIPDEWEQLVIANSGGEAASLEDVGPGKDLDGDGMNDDEEFWYGSFAFLAGDELRISAMQAEGDRYGFEFLTANGAMYWVESTSDLGTPSWSQCPIAMTTTNELVLAEFRGDGDYMTVYIAPEGSNTTYVLRAR